MIEERSWFNVFMGVSSSILRIKDVINRIIMNWEV